MHLIKSSLRVTAISANSYSPKGWIPKLTATVMGPTPEAEVVWTVRKPDGAEWLEARASVGALAEEEGASVDLCLWDEAHEITEAGDCAFTLRAENEMEGVDVALHEGTFTATKHDGGDADFGVGLDWLLPLGLVAWDVDDDKDAPKLRATVFLGGDVQSHELTGLLFHGGTKVAEAEYATVPWTSSTTAGTPLGSEVLLEFDTVRAWNNLRTSDPTWRADDHWLDVNPGGYEVRVGRTKKVVRTVGFTIDEGGMLVTDGRIEPDLRARPTAWFRAEAKGDLDGVEVEASALEQAAYGGDLATAALTWNLRGMYWYRKADEGAPAEEAPSPELQAVIDKATTQIRNWEDDLANDRADLDQCTHIIIPECTAYAELRAALGLPDDHPITVLDEATTLGATTERVAALKAAAEAKVAGAAQAHEDALAPFRAVLANDKLAIFEDHPADSFEYLTSNKKLIETPEELAEAEYWYFEGLLDLDAEAEVDGRSIKGKVRGWRVLGYRFDAEGNTVDEWEEQGTGSSSPKSAYQHHKAAAPVPEPAKKTAKAAKKTAKAAKKKR